MGSGSRAAGAAADLSTRARIRDAAIRTIAENGQAASLRAIAAEAEVSAALILHHFGSRAGLREACDRHVLEQMRDSKSAVLGSAGPAAMLAQLAQIEEYAPLVGYVMRCVQAGDEVADHLIEGMVTDAEGYLAEGVRAGTVRPSRDPAARARLLTHWSLGGLVLRLPAHGGRLDLDELPAWLRRYAEEIITPALELYTEPLLTDSTLLDAYLASEPTAEEH